MKRTAWAIKTPRGRIMTNSVDRLLSECWWKSRPTDYYYGWKSWMYEARMKGYRAVKVQIEEVK